MPDDHVAPESAVRPGRQNSLGIPVAIVIAAALIASAIYFGGQRNAPVGSITGKDLTAQVTPEIEVAPVTEDDLIRGNPNAPIIIIEYSDYDCPFCKFFHETMQKIIAKYGANGQVAWVYRHFPIDSLHPNAPKLSAAAKCVAELGGDVAFWKFSDELFNSRQLVVLDDGRQNVALTDMAKIKDFATVAGVDGGKFDLCFSSGKYDAEVREDVAAAVKAGAQGTPYSVIMIGDQRGVIEGAQPYENVDQMIGNLVAQMQAAQTEQ